MLISEFRNSSLVEYYGHSRSSDCGYCKKKNAWDSHAMWGHTLTAVDYQNLIDRGWRRSGKYCYKPSNITNCCPAYTIKHEVLKIILTKSHKKVLNGMIKFLKDGIIPKKNYHGGDGNIDDDFNCNMVVPENHLKEGDNLKPFVGAAGAESTSSFEKGNEHEAVRNISSKVVKKKPENISSEMTEAVKKDVARNERQKKAKTIRIERKIEKLAKQGLTLADIPKKPKEVEKSLEDYIYEMLYHEDGRAHKLKISLIHSEVTDESYALYSKYQSIVHKEPPHKCSLPSFNRFLCESPIKILNMGSNFYNKHGPDLNTINNSNIVMSAFPLYAKYQKHIHTDPSDFDTFKSFLVESPIQYDYGANAPPEGFGSFHQHYMLDNKLIAVGVVDVLPGCVSSVYFFYDPDYSFLSLGTFGALMEIAFVRQLNLTTPSITSYYMGYYIHSCVKMRYKAQFKPSFLLCPEVFTWQLITDELLKKLDQHKYLQLDADPYAIDCNLPMPDEIELTLMNNGPIVYFLKDFKVQDNRLDLDEVVEAVEEFATLIGSPCCRRMIFNFK